MKLRIDIDMDRDCKRCGKKGAVDGGLCLPCLCKWMEKPPDNINVEMDECPRNEWYAPKGRQLRAEGWGLRKTGDKWNLKSALIERIK